MRTLRADPPPASTQAPLPALMADRSGETEEGEVVRNLALLSDPLSVPVLSRAISSEDALEPQEAYVASLLGEMMTVQAIVDVSPMGREVTMRFLSRLVGSGLVTVASMRARI